MSELHFPWLEIAVVIPLLGSLVTRFTRDADRTRRRALAFASATLLVTLGAWIDFESLRTLVAHDRWDMIEALSHVDVLVIDELSAPLLPLTALLFLLTTLATLRSELHRFTFATALLTESILLATLSCKEPWPLVALLVAGTVPLLAKLVLLGRPSRVYALHMVCFAGLLISGQWLVATHPEDSTARVTGVVLLTLAVMMRSGVVPLHLWLTDLFTHASLGTSLLFLTPMIGAYGAVRLVLPIAPDWALRSLSLLALATMVYAAGMALVQTDGRRFFCYLCTSHASLVLVGLELATPVGVTGGLCVWLSVALAMTGFGLSLRAIETRQGRLDLSRYYGLQEQMPILASFFLLTGLAAVGFPATIGFVGAELLVEGALHEGSLLGTAVVLGAAFNGIAVLRAYFRLFGGRRTSSTIPLGARPAEHVAISVLAILILGGGLFPQPGILSRYRAAMEVLEVRACLVPEQQIEHGTVPPGEGSREQPLAPEAALEPVSCEEEETLRPRPRVVVRHGAQAAPPPDATSWNRMPACHILSRRGRRPRRVATQSLPQTPSSSRAVLCSVPSRGEHQGFGVDGWPVPLARCRVAPSPDSASTSLRT